MTLFTLVNTLTVFALGARSLLGATVGWLIAIVIAVLYATWYFLGAPVGSATTTEPLRRPHLLWSWSRLARRARATWYIPLLPVIGVCIYVPARVAFFWDRYSQGQQSSSLALLTILFGLGAALIWIMGLEIVDSNEPWVFKDTVPSRPRSWVASSARRASFVTLGIGIAVLGLAGIVWLADRFAAGQVVEPQYGRFGWLVIDAVRSLQAWGVERARMSSLSMFISAEAWPVIFAAAISITFGVWYLTSSIIWLLDTRISEFLLVRKGLVPRNYLSFLDHAVQLSLLQRFAAGEYAFSHQLIRDHFIRSSEVMLSDRKLTFAITAFDRLISKIERNGEDAPQQVPSPPQV
jgi:hypothetical protein